MVKLFSLLSRGRLEINDYVVYFHSINYQNHWLILKKDSIFSFDYITFGIGFAGNIDCLPHPESC